MKNPIIIATRSSKLALWQAEWIQARLEALHPGLEVKLELFKTQGDIILDTPLAKIGGKGLFVKELEQALLENKADIAVHSMKDVPVKLPDGLEISVITERETPFDAFVSNNYKKLSELPQGAKVGTSSLRRIAQLAKARPDLEFESLRGNVNTRLRKLDEGQYDAIILAAAGLVRLGFEDRIADKIPAEISLPAIGQGVVSIETRIGDTEVLEAISTFDHAETRYTLTAERAFLTRLNGGCQVPLGGYAILEGDELWLRGLVATPDGKRFLTDEGRCHKDDGEKFGVELAERMLNNGAREILAEVGIVPQ